MKVQDRVKGQVPIMKNNPILRYTPYGYNLRPINCWLMKIKVRKSWQPIICCTMRQCTVPITIGVQYVRASGAGGHTLLARNVASNSRYGSQLSFSELFGNFTDLFTNLNLFSDKTNKYKKKTIQGVNNIFILLY